MKNPQLLAIALLGAPFLCIGVYVEMNVAPLANSWWTGVWGLLYMTGWLASLKLMRRLQLTSTDPFGRHIVPIVQFSLLVANVSNVWQLVAPTYKPLLFTVLDMAWPLSNILMLAVGVVVLRAGRLRGYGRWVPLAVGLWLPLTLALSPTLMAVHFSNLYSLFAWTFLAMVMWRESSQQERFNYFDSVDGGQRVEAVLSTPT